MILKYNDNIHKNTNDFITIQSQGDHRISIIQIFILSNYQFNYILILIII